MNALSVIRRNWLLLLALLCVTLSVFSLDQAWSRGVTEVRLAFPGGVPEGTRVFFAGNEDFNDNNSLSLPADAQGDVSVLVPAGLVERIRVVPLAGSAASLCVLEVTGAGSGSLDLTDYRVIDRRDVRTVSSGPGCVSVAPIEGATDSHVTLGLQSGATLRGDYRYWLVLGVALFCTFLAMGIGWLRTRPMRATGHASHTRVMPSVPGPVLLYVAISLVFGTLYALVTPPGAVTDEYAHVAKAAKMANGAFLGATDDRLFPNIHAMYGRFDGYLDPSVHFSGMQLINQLQEPVPCHPTTADLPKGADGYSPTLYVMPAAAYAFSCATGQDLGVFLLLARLGNLLLATALIALGIWATVRARWVLFVCALLPMSIYQIASVSADALYIATSLAWLGAVCGVAEERIPVRRALWVLGPLAICLAFSKPGAAWVLIAIVFARPAWLRQVGSFIPAAVKYMLIPFAIHIAWVMYASSSATPLQGVDPAANLMRMIESPLEVIRLFVNTFVSTYGLWILKSMLAALGWLDVSLAKASYLGLLFCLAASVFMGRPALRAPLPTIAWGWVFAAGAVAMLSLPLYLFWSGESSVIIMGLQGRYFIPCAAFALCFSAGPFWAGRSANVVQRGLVVVVPAIMMLALGNGLFALIARYYP
ncbi:DUF2142 domain-containing protein [Luteimonas terrae]|uniref:Membrane protein n=1 Tax=Luteimonas terrae TaxID=1530191 RepID=A0ABU1XZF5_9GAMM|nr:DUF2142 domain-containing protein [Luteimonas terrae]MDR7194155.1 putative membrane protein [Luteimonas terrae]